jgi:hypothetical protein
VDEATDLSSQDATRQYPLDECSSPRNRKVTLQPAAELPPDWPSASPDLTARTGSAHAPPVLPPAHST